MTNTNPLFTVVIPTYNRAGQVAAAVRSVLAQTERDFECFVVDDGSTDATPRILAGFKDARLRLTFNQSNRGQHACRNQAIRAAKGDWVCFLDSDDVYLPSRLAELKRAIAARSEHEFWFTNAYLHRYGRIVGTLFDRARTIPEGRVPGYYAVGDSQLPYVTTMVCVRREVFGRVGFFREDMRILEDTELYARMFKAGTSVGAVREPLAVRFLHEGQITHDYRKDFEESVEALRSAGAPADVAEALRSRMAVEAATYLWKSLQPTAAREFLRRELGAGYWKTSCYYKTFLPAFLLRLGRSFRTGLLKLRYHPTIAPAEFREALETIRPFLTAGEVPGG